MNGSARSIYTPRLDVTPERELEPLVMVYAVILKLHEEEKGGPATAQDDPKEIENDRATTKVAR